MGLSGNVNVRKHTRRRTGRSAEIAKRLGFPDTVTVEGFERRRPAAAPRWVQTSFRPGFETYSGKYKDVRLYVGRAADGTWYWSARKGGKDGFFIASVDLIKAGRIVPSGSPGEAARRAELAAGYEFAGEILRANITSFLDKVDIVEPRR